VALVMATKQWGLELIARTSKNSEQIIRKYFLTMINKKTNTGNTSDQKQYR
jgi:hypothetical protein